MLGLILLIPCRRAYRRWRAAMGPPFRESEAWAAVEDHWLWTQLMILAVPGELIVWTVLGCCLQEATHVAR